MLTKTAHAELSVKIAHIDQIDTQNAFELGFKKQAAAMGATQEQYEALYRRGLELLTKA